MPEKKKLEVKALDLGKKEVEDRAQDEPLNKSEANMTGIISKRPPMSVPVTGLDGNDNDDHYRMTDESYESESDFQFKGLIFKRMVDVMKDVDAIVKTKQKDSGVPYAFRSIEDIMNALHPILTKHEVFIIPVGAWTENLVHPRQNKGPAFQCIYKSAYRFYTIDGSYVEGHMVAESIDYSDKATQQASSYCYKKVIEQAFCIPTRDLISDGDDKLPDRTDEGQQAKLDASRERLKNLPSPNKLPPHGSPMYDPMKPEDWDAVKAWFKPFVPLGFNKDSFHHWTIKTLRANNLDVPPKLADLPRTSGLVLNEIAQYCYNIGSTVHTLTQEKDEGEYIILTEISTASEPVPESAPENLGTDGAL